MSDSQIARKLLEDIFGEDLRYLAHGLVHVKTLAIGRHHAGRLLPAMLQLVQSEVRHGGGFKVIVHRHHAAFVFKFVASLQHRSSSLLLVRVCCSRCARLGAVIGLAAHP